MLKNAKLSDYMLMLTQIEHVCPIATIQEGQHHGLTILLENVFQIVITLSLSIWLIIPVGNASMNVH